MTSTTRSVVAFCRRYVQTWVHAVATAAMTAFGTLTVVDRRFAVLAIACYLVPPLGYYVVADGPWGHGAGEQAMKNDEPAAGEDRPADGSATNGEERDTTTAGPATREQPPDWQAVDLPTGADLTDVVVADEVAYAVGDDGVVLAGEGEREADDWRVALADGPGAQASDLTAVDATADGAVWVAGAGGALGRLDPDSGRHRDLSAPRDRTDEWTDLAVTGADGNETVVLATGSGELLWGRYRDGDCRWDAATKPGTGSSITAVALRGQGEPGNAGDVAGYCCDTNDGVFAVSPGEATARDGLDARGVLWDAVALAGDGCLVADGSGVVHHYRDGGWTPTKVSGSALAALDATEAGDGQVAAGDDRLYRHTGSRNWESDSVVGVAGLRGVALGDRAVVAVGEAGMAAVGRFG
ncbi:hypothetical protein [Haloarchaeobius amylolyticus]|uniref:hypothetical protein n=1 Tax=Haloarchaeobius amylolyticus TaxID=1198296 RepID=UPI0022720846|nr:hypothetical protein [Haloarchaeobius amylolyticus]